jgi:similar to stage IV sporulation protein
VYQLQDKMIKSNENIMWIKARIEGTKLMISIAERVSPPEIVSDDTPCNLLAKRDGQVVRVYTMAGTAVVKPGDIVKSGQLIVKGEQGKEGSVYAVHAQGDVIAKTFYEEIREVPVVETERQRTGNKDENIYVEIAGKKIYLRKSLNRFDNYDKIVNNKLFIKTESLYEVKEITLNLDTKKVIDDTVAEIYSKITVNLDKSVKIVDKIIESEPQGDKYRVRVAVIGEENIAIPQKIQ